MVSYKHFYNEFLGVKEGLEDKRVFTSDNRDRLLNQKYLYPILFTEVGGKFLCSTSAKYTNLCETLFDGCFESISAIEEHLNQTGEYSVRKIYRYTTTEFQDVKKNDIVPLSAEILRHLDFELTGDVEAYIKQKSEILKNKSQFAIIQNKKIASTAFISDLYGIGGNIVVFTKPQYRGLGYGKDLVKACINWCLDQNKIPLYYVDSKNNPSISLAENMGLELKNTEWVIEDMNKN